MFLTDSYIMIFIPEYFQENMLELFFFWEIFNNFEVHTTFQIVCFEQSHFTENLKVEIWRMRGNVMLLF